VPAVAKLVVATAIAAHSFYPDSCCGGKDCRPVPCGEIQYLPDGWKWHGIFFPRAMLRRALDDACHVCVGDANDPIAGGRPHCIFLQPES